ncbi:hypothetical protein NDA16_002808 [Ustilago loliicola]|nr:hypothetical protein NDA16_002808 [Ustilago loliicola]
MAFSLQEALEQIRSDKIKERQQGLEALEHIFSDLDNVYNLDPKQEGKAWLKTFQSLFACVLAEKAACIRKGSFSDAQPVALARLQRAAQMLRSLVEKAASLLTRKVVKALVTHILQMLNHRGTLLRPIAPAYTSALCAILKHQHHVDHLDPEDWWAASSLCFDILLGRDLDGTAAATKPEQWLASIPTPPSSRTDRRVLSLEDAVTAECLRHLMACTVAPLFGPDAYGVQLLADYTRFILTFSMESSAHLPAMTGLVILIEHLELNHTREAIYASLAMRHIIFALWNTKNHLLKIQLLLFLRNVSPLLASCATKQSEVGLPHDHPNFAALRIEAAAFLELAYETLLRDPDTRWGLEPLRLDALVFRWPQHPEAGSSRTPPALSNSAFYLGPYSAEQDTLAWCRLSLQIDLLEALVSLDSLAEENGTSRANHREGAADELPPSTATTSQPSNSPTKPSNGKRGLGPASSSPQKRRKMEATIRSFKVSWLRQLLNVITGAEQSSSQTTAARLCALQLLTFVVLTHPNLIRHDDVGDGIQKQLLQLPVHTDVQLVSWSLVVLGAIAMMYDTANTKITDSNFNFVQTPSFRLPRIRYGCQVIIKTVDVASTSKSMRADEYSLVIEQLALLLPSDTSLRQVDPSSNSLLRHPGAASGIAANSLAHNLEKGRGTSLSTTADQSCERIWAAIRDADMLAKMLSCCEQVLERALLGDEESDDQPASAAATSSRDAFDDMPESGSSSTLRARTTVLQPYSQSTDAVVSIAVRLLSEVPRMLTGTADSQRDERIVSLFFDSPVEAMISLAPALLRSRRNGTLWISQRDLVDALDRIGSELLTSYRLAKQPVARIAAVHAVSDVVPLLLEELDEQSDLFDKVQKLAIFFADQIGRTKWPAPWQVQLACADFLAECLRLDPESRICRSGSARGPTFSPLNALLQVNADADIRVRGLGSPIASTVFDKQSSNEAHVASIYSTFRDGLPSDSNIPQHILTRALSLCNVAIANSSVRRSSLFHLLEIVVATGMLPVTVQQLFAQVAARLGFAEASTCYQAFAAQITWGMATNAYDPLQLPWKVLGFASKRECLEATFASCGSMLLALQTPEGRTQFEALVHLTRRTRQQGLQECLPFLTAAYLGFAVEVGQKDGQPNLPGICEQALHELSLLGFAESDNHSELRQMITNADDLIVTTLLSLYHEPGADVAESWQSAVTALMQQDAIPIFRPIGLFVSTTAEAARALFPILLLCFTSTDIELGTLSPPRSNSKKRVSGRQSQPQEQGHVREFCCAAVAKHFEQVLESSTSDPACSEIIVKALLAVRSFRPMQEEPDTVCYWYNVDTNLLAQRCITCGMFSAAIFFVEHGAWQQGESPASGAPSVRTRTNLLHQAYMNIDDPDAFYGITDGDVRELLLKRLHHEGQWLRAFQYHAADFEASSSDGVRRLGSEGQSLRQSLSSLGFKRLFESVGPRSEAGLSLSIIPTSYYGLDAAGWDLPKAGSAVPSKGRNLDTVLQALRQLGAEQDADKALSVAIPSQLQALCSTPLESIAAMRAIEGELLSLGQVKDWRKACASLGPNEAVAHLRATWTRVDTDHHFDVTEKVLNTRQAVLQAARQQMSLGQIGDTLDGSAAEAGKVERSLLVLLSRQAREHEKLQKAINATARAERIESVIDDRTNIAREEFAAVLWEQNEHSPAIQLLSQIVDDLSVKISSPAPQKRRGARLLALLAQWRATARSQHPREIDRALFDPALKLIATSSASETATTLGDPAAAEEQSEIAYRWARFAEEHHRGSDLAEITRLRLYIDRRSEEIAQNQRECERTTSRTERGKLLQFQRQAEKMLRQDQTRLTELEASRTHFLHRSVAMYARALASADIHDDAVARLISLWFENAADASLNRLLTTSLTSIPSRKFVALMHQLSARLTEVSDSNDSMAPFQKNLAQLLLRMCQDHPFHCLYAIFALIKTGADDKAATQRPSPRNSLAPSDNLSSSPSPQVLRSTAAEKIWNHIKRRPALNKRIKAFEELCLAYVEWAEYDLTSRPDRYFQSSGSIKKGALRMPPSGELRLARMRNVDVPVATGRLEIDPTCRYESFISIARYSDTFTTAGGLHLPKISECVGSDGKRYKQLFKRDDDLRQDAVMQQVFRVVNELLHADRRTRERHLTIRTYTVLPLGPQCGMLEFVTNTVPLGEVLLALHEKYRGNDLTPTQARAKIRDAQSLPAEVKLEAFLDVCEGMRPALHYFFSDAQRMPREWYETRLRYTRSVSTNSIVGHTLGLGDRHVSNILLDNKSGELVHIDFGVAFDQGKLLPIPELVPFRLTRDIVDGMGINGVEGTFRRCCEETLRVLRAHQDVIKTVLEVFRHDPLFAWTSNPIKVVQRQAEDECSLPAPSIERSRAVASGEARSTPAPTPTPTLTDGRGASSRSTTPLGLLGEIAGGIGTDTAELSADRAITSVMAKLSSSLSIEYTVNDLIQQAMDAGNLSAIFHGWQAAL